MARTLSFSVAGIAALVAIITSLASAGPGDSPVRPVSPANAIAEAVTPGQPGPAPSTAPLARVNTQPSIPVPTVMPPGEDGAAPRIGTDVDVDNPGASTVPLPHAISGSGTEGLSAQVSDEPISEPEAAGGIAFRYRYYGVYRAGDAEYQVAVLEASRAARGHGLLLGARMVALSDGSTAYAGPSQQLAFPTGRTGIVIVAGGRSDGDRIAFVGTLAFE